MSDNATTAQEWAEKHLQGPGSLVHLNQLGEPHRWLQNHHGVCMWVENPADATVYPHDAPPDVLDAVPPSIKPSGVHWISLMGAAYSHTLFERNKTKKVTP